MAGENETIEKAETGQDDGSGYERSSIAFPYFDLGESLKIARAISSNNGAQDCTDDQIAAWVSLSAKSSGYRSRMSAARLFGLIESGAAFGTRLSDLGFKALDENHARAAKAEAFLNVPLFKRVYENWKSQQIPPPAALERAMVGFGVAEKQKARARQVLERSAEEAGFFEHGKDRLVRPGTGPASGDQHPQQEPPSNGGGGAGGGGPGGGKPPELDPILQGLINRLPKAGEVWPKQERALWLKILESSFELVYRDNEKSARASTQQDQDDGAPE